eukprot:2449866-Alexandrium_andersonii.AAC.1
MSASLVGSEMCIRDSGPPAGGLLPGPGRSAGLRGSRGLPERWPAGGASICLLYTSDAADDM